MAEFRISRFRYTWRSDWTTSRSYNKDDVVKYGGSSWVCIRQHTSSIFASDQTFLANPSDTDPSPAWTKMTDGRAFRGDWQSATLYNPGDVVVYGGNLYLVVNSYTSSGTFDDGISFYAVYSSHVSWTDDWTQNTRYGIGDLVKYGGIVYRCTQGHTSQTTLLGLEADQSAWTILNEGVEYRGVWQDDVRYRVNDLVKYGGTVFRCNTGHQSAEVFSGIYFDVEFFGNSFKGTWNGAAYYSIGDVVRYGGYLYIADDNNFSKIPGQSIYQPIGIPVWRKLANGIIFRSGGIYSPGTAYRTGEIVRRGGDLYTALRDIENDGSTLDYLDDSNFEIVVPGDNYRGEWSESPIDADEDTEIRYYVGDLVVFEGTLWRCNRENISSSDNWPSEDTGSEFYFWDPVILSSSRIGSRNRGDLITYDLSRDLSGDGSTFDITRVPVGSNGQYLSIDNENSLTYITLGNEPRKYYVSTIGVDDSIDPLRGVDPRRPWRTIRFACEQADDGFSGFTTIAVSTGKYNEVLPIILPARTVILGDELRSVTINAKPANPALSEDSTYTKAALIRISTILPDLFNGILITRSTGNATTQVETPLSDTTTAIEVQDLIIDITRYIDFYINSTGSDPVVVGTNTAETDAVHVNAVELLEANKDFLADEAVAYIEQTYPDYQFLGNDCRRDVKAFIDAWKYDLIYTGNYKSILAARYYKNAVLGSQAEDMIYVRDSTGVRNCTLTGLTGELNPPNVFNLYRRPTGKSFISLDPGWGADDERTWITNRSPYIQNVTNIGTGCIGQKIDGSLHNGGNKSIVSNDFTQVISDGIGAWVTNNGRAELVSVFTYYAQVGYLAENGGIIRSTNGNNSYGRFGAIADDVDPTETPKNASVFNRNQQAIVAQAFAGEVNDFILLLEWSHAGENYTTATATFTGSGIGASVIFEDFRDNAIFQSRIIDTSNTATPRVGGGGYTVVGGNAQVSLDPATDLTGITLASNDPNLESDYLGMRITIVSGVGTGQYGYITSYDDENGGNSKIVTVSRESDNQPGWDHIVPGTPIQTFLNSTAYRIEPRVIFSAPPFQVTEIETPVTIDWGACAYGETTETYNALTATSGSGETIGVTPVQAVFNVQKIGREYTITMVSGGAGYDVGDELLILGSSLGGATPINDITITVLTTSDDSTNSILTFSYEGVASSGRFVLTPINGIGSIYSKDGETWSVGTGLPSIGDWLALATGDNKFVTIKKNSNQAASSLNGISWTTRTMPASREWNAVVYGDGKFVAVAGDQNSAAYSTNGTTWTLTNMATAGDSSFNEWVDVTYGKGKFVAVANSNNIVAESSDGITWVGHIMDVIDDSSQKDWVSIAYGNNRYVAISSTGEAAYSFDTVEWYPAEMPKQDGSTAHYWRKIRYAQGVFFAIGDSGSRTVGDDATSGPSTFAATSPDGIVWTNRELETSLEWRAIGFGNPYIDSLDSTVGKNTPIWISAGLGSDKINKIWTGARALGRVNISSGVINDVRLWDPGSGYDEAPELTLIDPTNTTDVGVVNRLGDGVLSNPSWLDRGTSYRTSSTVVSITGDGYADIIPSGRFVTISDLEIYPGPGAQLRFTGNDTVYTVVQVTNLNNINGGLAARFRISPVLEVRDNLGHGTNVEIRELYSQCRITGHDFLDIGTGNFEETNYPTLYSTGLYNSAPENEVVEEDGGRVFYTATDQSGNFRTGELFAVEQATGIVTISADFFDLDGLDELALGGVRIGGSGTVIREFSTDPLFTEDSNNIVPTQRAVKAYLNNRLTVGGSSITTASFIAGTVRVGPTLIASTISGTVRFSVQTRFEGAGAAINGSMIAYNLFFKSFQDYTTRFIR